MTLGSRKEDKFERNTSKLKNLIGLDSIPSIYCLHSCTDAGKWPKIPIPYLFVFALFFIVHLPKENVIPLPAFHRAGATGLLFCTKDCTG